MCAVQTKLWDLGEARVTWKSAKGARKTLPFGTDQLIAADGAVLNPELLIIFDTGLSRVGLGVERDFLGEREPLDLTGARTDYKLLSVTLDERRFE